MKFIALLTLVIACSASLFEKEIHLDDQLAGHGGYLELNNTNDGHMFYTFFPAREDADSKPLTLWMTGGPGCSSELALFYEQGPYRFEDKNLTLKLNEYGWDVSANMIFVDQPLNVGFSWTTSEADHAHDEVVVADDMLQFLLEFVDLHPEYKNRELFITGESYAGHYVPCVAHRVWKARSEENVPLNIQGFAVGNGLTNPALQYPKYSEYAYQNNMISKTIHDQINENVPECVAKIDTCNAQLEANPTLRARDVKDCMDAVDNCETNIVDVIFDQGDWNPYDIRIPCQVPGLCYDFSDATNYLKIPEVRTELGVKSDIDWQMCDNTVHSEMMGDWMKDYSTIIPDMLKANLRVMIYAGNEDFICNWIGNYNWVNQMPWSGQADFNKTELSAWNNDKGTPFGEFKTSSDGLLSFVKVFDAGHMVPMDQPEASLDMITKFMTNTPFN